jgi:4-hydroxy-tetrahydrodipicolinate synthase
MNTIKGVMALLPTPLTHEYTVDGESLRRLIDYDMENGCDGVGVLAAIGEGYLISDDDRRSVIKIAADRLDGAAPLIAGCPAMGTTRAVQLCREAEDLGADGILAFNPQSFRTYTTAELVDHFRHLISAVDIAVLPYARADDPIPFEVMSTLVNENGVRHMKNGWHDCEFQKRMSDTFGDRLLIFCGADTYTLRYLQLGCQGILTATVAVWPKENVQLFKMVQDGDMEGAREYYAEKILTWNDIGFYENWQAVHKLALQEMGVIKTSVCMPPQAPAMPHQVDEVKWLVRHHGKEAGLNVRKMEVG